MRLLTFSILLLFVIHLHAQDSTAIDPTNANAVYTALQATYLELSLVVQSNFSPVYLKNTFIIAGDTFYDYIKIEKTGVVNMKTLKLDSGERVVAFAEPYQNFQDSSYYLNMQWQKNDLVLPEHISTKTYAEFIGTIWPVEQKVLFRFKKNNTNAERLVLHIGFSPGFDFSTLFLKTKMVYEYENALEKELEIKANDYRRKDFDVFVVSIPLEGDFENAGEYYLELEHEHFNRRINGISYISLERVKK